MNCDSPRKDHLNQATGAHMAIRPRCTVTASISILAAAFSLFSLSSIALHAQQSAQGETQWADLPDAPLPVAPTGSALERAAAQSSSASPSAQSPAQGSQPPAQGSPNPPGAPSLGDLGLTPEDTEGSAARQAIMDRRTHMLKLHQRLGLITVIPVAAASISAVGAPPRPPPARAPATPPPPPPPPTPTAPRARAPKNPHTPLFNSNAPGMV